MDRALSARIARVGGSAADNAALETALAAAGYTAYCQLPAFEAIARLKARELELVLLDLSLPNEEVVAVLRAAVPGGGRAARATVLVSAAATATERVASCLQHGADDYLTTPFDTRQPLLLTRRVGLALSRRVLGEATIRLNMRTAPAEAAIVEAYGTAADRFVPREFLDHLGRKSIAEVRLGDHVQRSMTVLFSDIRDFTTLSEGMSPQDNFDFLNSYLRYVTPLIRARHGFVDKYIGDAVMALFPERPADAVAAAVELQRQVVEYNAGRVRAGYAPIRIGIGIHTGELILGTIGEPERMQTTVIADAVNVASRIEGLTKTFGVPLLVSGTSAKPLGGAHPHRLRHLGAVRAKGKTRSVEIYECFDNDPEELIEHKLRTAEVFARGMAEFRNGLLLTAGRIFAKIAEMNAHDAPAAYFRDSCTLSVVRNRGERFDGVEVVEVK